MAKISKQQTVQKKAAPKAHNCPYCDVQTTATKSPICQACQVTITYCPHCGQPISKDEKTCKSCGH